jgi:hypothetical protein
MKGGTTIIMLVCSSQQQRIDCFAFAIFFGEVRWRRDYIRADSHFLSGDEERLA